MGDQLITCQRCGRNFIWSYGEQRYYREHNLHKPKRCESCRQEHKRDMAAREARRRQRYVTHRMSEGERRFLISVGIGLAFAVLIFVVLTLL
jgi:hypothetical protein